MAGRKINNFQDDIPETFLASVKTAVKARISVGPQKTKTAVLLVVTCADELLIFSGKKLLKHSKLPIVSCKKIIFYQSHQAACSKEFVLTLSECGDTALLDLSSFKVLKMWSDIADVKVKDHLLLGYPQILLQIKGVDNPKIITYESSWEDNTVIPESSKDGRKNSALQSVVIALENQLNYIYLNKNNVEKQIAQRQSVLNRSLTRLKDYLRKGSNMEPTSVPTFLSKFADNDEDVYVKMHEKVNIPTVKVSEIWQRISNQHWILGTKVINTLDKDLEDVCCVFNARFADLSDRTLYFTSNKRLMKTKSSADNNYSIDSKFSGQLNRNENLIIIVAVSVPDFLESAMEIGDLFLLYSFSEDAVQLNLGSVQLLFDDLCNHTFEIKFSDSDISEHHRHVLALMSVLRSEETIGISFYTSSPADSLMESLNLTNTDSIFALKSYHGFGVYGDVLVFVVSETAQLLEINIRARSKLELQWFIRRITSTLSDGAKLVTEEKTEKLEPLKVQLEINSALQMLAKAECDDDLSIIDEESNAMNSLTNSSVDNIRREFLKKQLKLKSVQECSQQPLKIPYSDYHRWQKQRYTQT